MSDGDTRLADIRDRLRAFTEARDWGRFHTPKDLTLALASEVGEVADLFRYLPEADLAAWIATDAGRRTTGLELADALWLLVRLADVCGVDLAAALEEKLALADAKYPADQARGKPLKYTHYRPAPPADG